MHSNVKGNEMNI